jgi:transposase
MNRKPKMKPYTLKDFQKQFPDDAACLDFLCKYFYPGGIFCKKCQRVTSHHKVESRPSYCCAHCGNHVHPTADTIFHKTTTPLTTWFYAMYLMASTRCGISAKQIERETGVTYKTAWRMFNKIRSMLDEGINPFGGPSGNGVEMDESYFGGKNIRGTKRGRPNSQESHKQCVVGIVERGGRAIALTSENAQKANLHKIAKERILPDSTVFTDDWSGYNDLSHTAKVTHKRINHTEKVYVMGDIHTQTVDGLWSLIKRGIGGVYHAVSKKWLQSYLNEYTFRYSRRFDETPMFQSFMGQVKKQSVVPASQETEMESF